VPVPDPSTLTTEALEREIFHLRELLVSRIDTVVKDLDALREHHEEKHVAAVNAAVNHFKELMNERLNGVQRQFQERDTRTEQAGQASKEAVTAAMTAAREATQKSEATMTKQIESIMGAMNQSNAALEDKVRAIEKRVDRDEGKGAGLSAAWAGGIALISVLVAIAAIVISANLATP